MATKYHYNPETGKTGPCPAVVQCRLLSSDGHFDTESEARSAYEKTMEHDLLTSSTREVAPKPRGLLAALRFALRGDRVEATLPPASAETQLPPLEAPSVAPVSSGPRLSYGTREDGGKGLKVGDLLANVKPGHELVIRRIEGLDEDDERTEQSAALARGESGSEAGAYWDEENGKAKGVFVFPLSLFNRELTLDQTALHMNLLMQDEMENYRYGSIGTYVVAEVKKEELHRPAVKAHYDVFQDEAHFEDMRAVNPGMKHGFDPETFDRLYSGSSERGKLRDVPEYSWDLNSKATEVHAFFGPDVDRWKYEQEMQAEEAAAV